MKGYFSQLAQNTGLSFEPLRGAQVNKATTPAPVSVDVEPGVPAPLEVEAIVLTPGTPAAAANPAATFGGEAPVAQTPVAAEQSGQASVEASPITERTASETPVQQNEMQSAAKTFAAYPSEHLVESRRARRESESAAEALPDRHEENEYDFAAQPLPESSWDAAEHSLESLVRVEAGDIRLKVSTIPEARHQNQVVPLDTEPVKPSAVRELDEHLEREVSVGDYLKEVMAWVSATPELDEQESDSKRAPEHLTENVYDLVQSDQATLTTASVREPEVHDLDLSIGSISIVIEEPKPAAPPSFAPAPRSEQAFARNTPEPTNFSRYYLRSW